MKLGSNTIALAALVALAATGCDDGDDRPAGGTDAGTTMTTDSGTTMTTDGGGAATRPLSLAFEGLPALGEDHVYEGWILVDGSPISTGRFEVGEDGSLEPATFDVDADMADAAATFVLTIEPATGDDPAPADTHILAGDLSGGEATLTMEHMAALGTGFADAAGTFVLATPSSASMEDNAQGIWWLVPPADDDDDPAPSLTLPELPAGWVYEGWVVNETDGPISTGTFSTPAEADSDGGGDAAGPEDTPPFPGQDFIDPARDLTSGHMAVISVEPDPDDSPAPFRIKPLGTAIGTDTAPTAQTMGNIIADNSVSGSASFE